MGLKLRGDINLCKKKKNKQKQKTSTEAITPQITFQGASAALPTMIDEYTKERERASILDNKAVSLITILIALLTVYIPLIPFDIICDTYLNGSKIKFGLVLIAVLMLIAAFIITAFSFIKLIRTIKLQEYKKADIDMTCKEEHLQCDKDIMEKALCEHYQKLIHYNSKINDDKVKKLSGCFTLVAIVFFLLLIPTVILKIVN